VDTAHFVTAGTSELNCVHTSIYPRYIRKLALRGKIPSYLDLLGKSRCSKGPHYLIIPRLLVYNIMLKFTKDVLATRKGMHCLSPIAYLKLINCVDTKVISGDLNFCNFSSKGLLS
jgi:hypothetical protein